MKPAKWTSHTTQKIIQCGVVILAILLLIPIPHLIIHSDSKNVAHAQTIKSQQEVTEADVKTLYGQLPLYFEENQGQTDTEVDFLAQGQGYSLYLTSNHAVFALRKQSPFTFTTAINKALDVNTSYYQAIKMNFVGGNSFAHSIGESPLPGISNYFIGNDPDKWVTNVHQYRGVRYQDVYEGIDVIYHGNQGELQYDFSVAPHSNPSQISFNFAGIDYLELDETGNLLLHIDNATVRQNKPFTYQEINGNQIEIPSQFTLFENGDIGFSIGDYNPNYELVIDPTFIYSTYIGGSGDDIAWSEFAVDDNGSAFISGDTRSLDYPVTPGAYQTQRHSIFLTKLSPSGDSLIYSTYLGNGTCYGFALDAQGSAYLSGEALSNFPVTPGAFDETYNQQGDVFVTKFTPAGNDLVYSTYIGGSKFESSRGMAVDSSGIVYVGGDTYSNNFPVTPNAAMPSNAGSLDAFMVRLSADGSTLLGSTYVGSQGQDIAWAVGTDNTGHAYLTGQTYEGDFPTTPGAFQPSRISHNDGFITKISPDATTFVYSSYLGGSDVDQPVGIEVTENGIVYLAGTTYSMDFPVTAGSFDTTHNGGQTDIFIVKLDATGSNLIYGTFVGGATGSERGFDIKVDAIGRAYVCGHTTSSDFPTVDPIQAWQGVADAVAFILSPDGSTVLFSTYVGGTDGDYCYGVDFDANSIYLMGRTESTDFPTVNPFQTDQGMADGFVSKIALSDAVVEFASPESTVLEDIGIHNVPVIMTVSGAGIITSPVQVDVSLAGTAMAGVDYLPNVSNMSVSFSNPSGFTAGTYTEYIPLDIIDDTEVEPTETIVLTLNPINNPFVSLGDITVHTVNILDNDVLPTETPIPTITPIGSPQNLNVSISKTAILEQGAVGLIGDQVTWQITVNNGGITTNNLLVTDVLPGELQIDNVTTTAGTVTIQAQTVTVNIDQLSAGASVQIDIVTTIVGLPANGIISNTAIVTGENISQTATAELTIPNELPETGYPPN